MLNPAFIDNIGGLEYVVILLAILLLFGGKKLPDMARNIGRGIRHFRDELAGLKKQIEDDPEDKDKKA